MVNRGTDYVKLGNYTSPFETEKEFEKITLKDLLSFMKRHSDLRASKYYALHGHIKWQIERIIWIGFLKNENNDECLIPQLPKSVVQAITQFVGKYVTVKDCFKQGVKPKNQAQ